MATSSKSVLIGAGALGLVVAFGLLLPVSNLFLKREYFEPTGGPPEFKQASHILQQKCADCHSPDMTVYPMYFHFPIANRIIEKDIKGAQKHLKMSKERLTGEEPFSPVALAKIQEVIEEGEMPPDKYTLMHWDAKISTEDKKVIFAWIKAAGAKTALQPIPQENPFVKPEDEKKIALGRKLYHETLLSGDGTISCATCHGLDQGGVDNLKTSTGIKGQKGPINAPTVYNAVYNLAQFWDGRAKDLKAQAGGPVVNPKEMGSNFKDAIEKLSKNKDYVQAFKEVYDDGITEDNITDAIATFEKTLITPDSRFDKYLAGDKSALTENELKGYELFKANNCATCHAGAAMGGMSFELMGRKKDYFKWRGHNDEADQGRFNFTHSEADRHKFKVPTLRNVALTWPYFHDGSTSDLKEAVKIMQEYQVGKPLSDEEADRIVDFLKALTGEVDGKLLTNIKQAPGEAKPQGEKKN